MTPPFSGRCLCGRVTYRCDLAPLWQTHCHCESCRRATASPFTSFFAIPDGGWRWTGAAPATYASSAGVTRSFCGTCGTPMAYRTDTLPDETHFFAVTLDHPELFAPTSHDFWDERLPWVHLSDGLPHT